MSNKAKSYLYHALFIIAVLGSPFMFLLRNEEVNMNAIYRQLQIPICMLAVFYLNYLWLVPRLLLRKKAIRFWLENLLMGGFFCFLLFCQEVIDFRKWWEEVEADRMARVVQMEKRRIEREKMLDNDSRLNRPEPVPDNRPEEFRPKGKKPEGRPDRQPMQVGPPLWFFVFRDGMMLAVAVGLAVMVRTNKAFHEAEAARKEAELGRAEAELKNLRNQINPHFLLNTLNNIYALIQFDSEKAQTTVLDLSKLLRFALYDNQQDFVSLAKEIEFEERYVNLMRIRVPRSADITFNHADADGYNLQVMPLVYISLIENAFKHGIRSNGDACFIRINLSVGRESVINFCIENSNFPKDDSDRSGSGIGLEQVQKRLDITYHGRYQWTKGVLSDGQTYRSQLIIETNPNKTLS